MARPKKQRSVESPPQFYRFKPMGKLKNKEKIILGLDEYEAVRLADHLGLDHSEASIVMGVSRPTFTRLLEAARNQVSKLLVEGREMEIKGGKIMFSTDVHCCRECRRPFRWEGEGNPVCPECKGEDCLTPHTSCNGSCSCCELQSGCC